MKRAATISHPLENMRAPRVRSTHPHTLPTRSCAADEARRAVLQACCVQTAACCLAARPALRAASARARAGRHVIECKCPHASGPASTLKDPSRDTSNGRGTLLTDAGPLAYASLAQAARELSGEVMRALMSKRRAAYPLPRLSTRVAAQNKEGGLNCTLHMS
ncbi:hypothetical protein T492DRAFT_1139828 [Pavlovales sp. CCMP2436]|nr:hypothetical protein T492DRAFT_1139828 [Pavlovales sp. CCMP2436]